MVIWVGCTKLKITYETLYTALVSLTLISIQLSEMHEKLMVNFLFSEGGREV